ncbi:MAG: integration host factor, actinobacterial type [Candidatus Nanopelagicales bacterium]
MVAELDADARARGRERALEARRRRAAIKRDVRAGQLSLDDVLGLRLSDPVVARMRVVDLLESLPGVGPVRAAVLLERCSIASTRRLRGLGEHQVAGLLSACPDPRAEAS